MASKTGLGGLVWDSNSHNNSRLFYFIFTIIGANNLIPFLVLSLYWGSWQYIVSHMHYMIYINQVEDLANTRETATSCCLYSISPLIFIYYPNFLYKWSLFSEFFIFFAFENYVCFFCEFWSWVSSPFQGCVLAFIKESEDEDVLVLGVQDPFHRLLLHGVCEVNW